MLYTPSFLLEIRVIIKILSNPWYPINFEKKNKNGLLKITEIFGLEYHTLGT
jgi:hypothetical protein